MMQADIKRFRIITPYDAQRNLIEKELKAKGLEWEDKCFNVDSFQGLFLRDISLRIFCIYNVYSRQVMKKTTS